MEAAESVASAADVPDAVARSKSYGIAALAAAPPAALVDLFACRTAEAVLDVAVAGTAVAAAGTAG